MAPRKKGEQLTMPYSHHIIFSRSNEVAIAVNIATRSDSERHAIVSEVMRLFGGKLKLTVAGEVTGEDLQEEGGSAIGQQLDNFA